MTSSDFDSLIRSYGKWLSDNTTYTQLDEWYEVNVPLLDEDNDYTQFYVKPGKNSVTFSDDCATLRRLESHGMTVTESRLAVLKDILNQFGIERNGDELTLTSDTADFADAKNRFLQAIIKVGDMSMLANPMCRRILQMTFVCSFLRTCTSLLREWCLWLWSGARFLLFAVSTSPQSPTATAPLGEGS